MPPSSILAAPPSGTAAPGRPVPRLHLDLSVSHSGGGPARSADALVLVFWLHVRNDTAGPLHGLHLLQGGFSDGVDTDLEYDSAPIVLAGPDERMEPGAGFVAVARYTARVLPRARTLHNTIVVRGTGADGAPVSGRAQVRVTVERERPPRVR